VTTNPNGARTRIAEWIKAYGGTEFRNDRLSCSLLSNPLYLSDVQSLVEAFDKPCGSCHPCDNYRDETWRAADRKPPYVYQWDEAQAALAAVAELVGQAEHAAVSVAALRKALAGETS
jgi:hypothetical protein